LLRGERDERRTLYSEGDALNTGNTVCPLDMKKDILEVAKNFTALAAPRGWP